MAKPPFELNEQQIEALRSKLTAPTEVDANRAGQVTAQQQAELISHASQFGVLGVVELLILLGAEAVVGGQWLAIDLQKKD